MRREAPPGRGGASLLFMRLASRLFGALVVALLLPFPGPHADRYTPVAQVVFRRDALGADPGFWVLAAILIAVYTAVVFGLLTLILALNRRARRNRGQR